MLRPRRKFPLPRYVLLGVLLLAPATARARLVVDHVILRGAAKTRRDVILDRAHLWPGTTVDFATLDAAQRRLLQSDLFSKVSATIDLPRRVAVYRMYLAERVYPVDIIVEVTEKQSWFVVPTASFGSGDWAGGVAYVEQNFLGRDVQLAAAGQIGESTSYAFVGFRNPLAAGLPLTYAFNGLYRFQDIRFYESHHLVLQVPTTVVGGAGEIGWVLSSHLNAVFGVTARHESVGAAEAIDPHATAPPYNPRQGRLIDLQFQFVYDDTVAPEGIREGVRLRLANELSDAFWGSDYDYIKADAQVELYGKFRQSYPSLILHATLAYPTSERGVPVTELVFIGGPNLRGYLVNEFHGDTLISAQSEDQVVLWRDLRVPFTSVRFNVAAAAFLDIAALLERHPGGTAAAPGEVPPESRPKLGDFHTSFGAGARIILPGVAIPAIKLDVGYAIDVQSVGFTLSIAGGL
jgi:outer membrane protein assembly factor BamA